MIGIYFSGTGNTKYCVHEFLKSCKSDARALPIEDENAVEEIQANDVIVFGYPIYFSNLPKIVRDFIESNRDIFKGKQIYLIATMGLFSGDGAGCGARLFKKHGAKILGGLHLKMPDCIGDEKLLKKTMAQNIAIIKAAGNKISDAAKCFEHGKPTREGLSFCSHIAGLLGQRLWFFNKTKKYSDKIKINRDKCIGCNLCVQFCPMKNLELADGKAQSKKKCTLCYRCFSNCPKQAITILGSVVHEQCKLEKYLAETQEKA